MKAIEQGRANLKFSSNNELFTISEGKDDKQSIASSDSEEQPRLNPDEESKEERKDVPAPARDEHSLLFSRSQASCGSNLSDSSDHYNYQDNAPRRMNSQDRAMLEAF